MITRDPSTPPRSPRARAPRLAAGLAPVLAASLVASSVAAAPIGDAAPAADPAAADPEALSDAAVARFKAKDYAGAVELFQQAHALDPKPNYLFNIGRVYEEAGQLREAVDYYQRFVGESGVDLESRKLANDRLRILREILATSEPAPAPAAKEPDPPPAAEPAPDDAGTPVPRARRVRIAGYALLGLGGAALAVGGGLGGLALKQSRDLAVTDGYSARQELLKAGQTNAAIADGLFIAGGVLALSGLVMVLSTVKPRGRVDAAARGLSPALGPGLAGLRWQGRF